MKKITQVIYVAEDGEEFSDAKACKKYEADGCVHLKPLPSYCDLFPLNDDCLRMLLGGDGSCYYATATRMSRITTRNVDHPKWATHLVYFGK